MEDGEIVWEEYSPFPRGKREEVERPKSTKLAVQRKTENLLPTYRRPSL